MVETSQHKSIFMPRRAGSGQVAELRSFNRFYTQRIGVLDEHLLQSPFSLTEARVLFELAQRKSCTASQISATLGLDQGYLSRIVQNFVKRRLLARNRLNDDTRKYTLSLTPSGRRAFQQLDGQSREQARHLVGELSRASRDHLFTGIRRVRHALSANAHGEVILRQHRPGDLGWAIELHGKLYADEYGWNEEFEALVATLFAAFATQHDPDRERFWIAEVGGIRIGCVFVVRNQEDPNMAQLRCLLVDPSARGLGVGRRLVKECIDFARAGGYRGMMLWTNDVLISARRIYEAAGFALTEEYKHHSFGHDLVGQIWMMKF